MHKITVVSILLSFSIVAFGQQKEEISLIQADSTWGREIIQLPFWFAPEINYTGHEDIRFAKGWEDINSVGFWTNLKLENMLQVFSKIPKEIMVWN
jgi:hypothetical protein